MNWLKGILTALTIAIFGMQGGQSKWKGGKAWRRYGIPIFAFTVACINKFHVKHFVLLLFIPLISMGYGVDSVYMKLFKVEEIVRLAKGLTLSIPFIVYGKKRWFWSAILLILAWQVQAGSLGYLPWFGDILIEDIFRWGTLGGLIAYNIFKRD